MASRKNTSGKTASKTATAAGVTSTPVRNSPIPRIPAAAAGASSPAARQITHDQIAARAYFIAQSGTGGDETHNWLRAERELRGA